MYQCGDQVLYGIHGVCRIMDLETKTVDRKKVEYYVLEPLDQPGARFYVPTQNQAAVGKLRRMMCPEELEALLRSENVRRNVWIEDENQRKLRFRELISSGDRGEMVCMVRTLHKQKQILEAAGRKFHLSDENFLRDAEKILNSEFSLVLKMEPSQVGEYVESLLLAD